MKQNDLHKILNYGIAVVWISNGLVCKLLDKVPRHQQIVAEIVGRSYSKNLIVLIGVAEIFMALWVLSGYKSKWNAYIQIAVVLAMNAIEFLVVPDLLLWGKFNALFAVLFCSLVYYNEFYLKPKKYFDAPIS